ncbi:MAG TPA: FAD:protein FMN transferase [Actinomycetes bacterium]|nr:FAD:protein FMN transferase [Actinomycetes bacterium]
MTRTVERAGHRLVRSHELLGETLHVDLRGVADDEAADRASAAAAAWLRRVDGVFGPGRDSAVSRLRRDRRIAEVDEPLVEDLLMACERAWAASDGWFDPWGLPGGFDPAGIVLGWALGPTAELLAPVATGVRIDAAGDVLVRGERAAGAPWAVGVRRPDALTDLTAVLDVTDIAVSTSTGSGVIDSRSGRPARRLRSATVVGPDAALADAFATALVACGVPGLDWLTVQPGYEAYAVDLDGRTYSTSGLPRRP